MRVPQSFLLACLVVSSLLAQAPLAHGQTASVIPPSKNDRWMTEIANAHPAYGKLKLSEALFPGAHDAGAYAPLTHFFAPDMPMALNVVAALTPALIPAIHGWSITQGGNFTSQLEAGVRFFDLRLCAPPPGETEPRLCHGFWAETLDTALLQIDNFLAQPGRSKEIVILNFATFSGYEQSPDGTLRYGEAWHDHTSRVIQNRLGARLVPRDDTQYARATLQDVWNSGRQVIANYAYALPDRSATFKKTNLWDRSISSPWPNLVDPSALKERVQANLACRCDSSNYSSPAAPDYYFFVLQIVGTADPVRELATGGPSPATSLQSLADLTNPVLIEAVLDRLHPNLNIVAADFVHEHSLVEAIKNLTIAKLDLERDAATPPSPRAYLSRTDSPDGGSATVMTSWNGTHFGYIRRIESADGSVPAGDAPLAHFAGRLWSGGLRVTTIVDDFLRAPREWSNFNDLVTDPAQQAYPSPIYELTTNGPKFLGNYHSASFSAAYEKLFVAWGGPTRDPHLSYRFSLDGRSFREEDIRAPHDYWAFGSPALASYMGALYAAWGDFDGRLQLGRIDSDNSFVHLADLGGSLFYAPAMTGFRDRLIYAWTGTGNDHRIRVMSTAPDGSDPSAVAILGDTSMAPPSLAVFKGSVILAYTGENGRRYTLVSPDGQNFSGDERSVQQLATPNVFAKPVLLAWGDRTIITWGGMKTADGSDYVPGTWTRLDVRVSFTCAAPVAGEYGVLSDSDPSMPGDEFTPGINGQAISSGTGVTKSATAGCVDLSGHLGTATVGNILQDTVLPSLEYVRSQVLPEIAPFDWYQQVVSTFNCLDEESGPAVDTVDDHLPEGAHVVPFASCEDKVGNVGEWKGPFSFHFNIDRTPPVIHVPASFSITVNAPVPITYSLPTATDSLSGLASFTCGLPSGSVFPAGKTTVTCTATDRALNIASASFDVTVNINMPPAINSISSGGPISEGGTATVIVDASDADGPLPLTYQFDCNNDGSYDAAASASFATACTFADNGQHTVRARVIDGMGKDIETTTVVTVTSVAPSGSFAYTGSILNEGASFFLGFLGVSDPSPADQAAGFLFAFDCGDGAGYGAPGPADSRTCPAADDGILWVRGKVRDKDGAEREYSANVIVTNVPPVVSAAASAVSLIEGQIAVNSGSFSDPGINDPVTISASIGVVTKSGANNGTWAWSLPTIDGPSTATVTITASDGDGGMHATSFALSVANVPPAANAGADLITASRQSFTLDGTWIDPAGLADGPYSWTWTPLGSPVDHAGQPLPATAGSGAFGSPAAYAADIAVAGEYAFAFAVTDKDGASHTDDIVVVVRNRFVAFGTNSVDIKANATITGDLGAPNHASGPALTDLGVEMVVGTGVALAPGSAVYADSLIARTSVPLAYFNELTGSDAGNITTAISPLPIGIVAPSWARGSGAPGTENIWLDGTRADCRQPDTRCLVSGQTLAPGRYADLRSRAGSGDQPNVLMLTAGDYYFEAISLGRNTRLLFTGPARVYVAGSINSDADNVIGPADGSGIAAHDIVFAVGGISGPAAGPGSQSTAVELGMRDIIHANVYAPNGTIRLRSQATATGAFVARDVEIGVGVTLTLDSAFK